MKNIVIFFTTFMITFFPKEPYGNVIYAYVYPFSNSLFTLTLRAAQANDNFHTQSKSVITLLLKAEFCIPS